MGKAKAPSRGGDKVLLSFGLVTIGVHLLNGIDPEANRITRKTRYGDGHEVGYATYDKVTGEQISKEDTYMVYVTDEGVEVPLSDDEMTAAMGYATEEPQAEMLGVYPLSEAKKLTVAGVMQARPSTVRIGTKKTRPYDKPFNLFMGALEDSEAFVLVKYVSAGKPRLVAVFGTGEAWQVHWINEVRDEAPMPEVESSTDEEWAAAALVETLMEKEPLVVPENVEIAKVREYADAKAQGVTIPEQTKAPQDTQYSDLLATLEASVAAAKGNKK